MTLLTRYVLREVLQIFLLTLTTLTLFMLVVGVGKEALSQGFGPLHLLQILPYLLPNALLFAIPGTILLAASMVYGRMSNFGEIVAIKSLGISPMAVIWPTLFLSLALSLLTVWLNDLAVSWGNQGVKNVFINSMEDIILSVLKTKHAYATKSFSILVQGVEGRTLIQPVIELAGTEDSPKVTIAAREAEFQSLPEEDILKIAFREGRFEAGETAYSFDEQEFSMALDQVSGKSGSVSPSHLSLMEIPDRAAKQKIAIERGKQLLAAKAAFRMMTGDFAELGGTTWSKDASAAKELETTLNRLRTEPPRRWANGFSCFCFALVGVPLAIRLRNSDVLTSFFLCFGPILVIYYPLLLFGLDRSKAGAVHPMTVWVANLTLAFWGVWLLRKVIRY